MVDEGRVRRLLDRIAEETAALRRLAVAGFRNVLVHVDDDVDDERVLAAQRTRLDDLDAFRRHLAAGLTGEEPTRS